MKKIIIILLLLVSITSYGQLKKTKKTSDDSVTYISNKSNFDKSPFSKLLLKKEKTKHSFIMEVNSINLSKYYNKRVSKIIGVDEYKLNTALAFSGKDDPKKRYYYPINTDKFNMSSYSKSIKSNSDRVLLLKIYVTIYRTSSTPIVVIDCVKISKE